MKTLLLSLALMAQVGLTMANDKTKTNTTLVQVRNNNVKMFAQAGTSTAILETISTADRVELVRKFNRNWAIVMVNDKVGYVLISEITNLQTAPQTKTLASK